MKLVVDSHTHTVASSHAYSTILENVEYAKKNNMKMICWTDHAHKTPGGAHPWHFWNLKIVPRVVNGIIVLKGAEANILDDRGGLDSLEDDDYMGLDIVIASIHSSLLEPKTKEYHTNAYINAIKTGKVNIIGHPDDKKYDFFVEEVVKVAKEYNVAMELNNASMNIGRSDYDRIDKILNCCKEYGVCISCGSDAHFAFDVGNFSNIIPILKKNNFPEKLILNTDEKKFLKFFNL